MEWVKVFSSVEEAKKRIPLNSVVPVLIGNHEICLGHLHDGFFAIDDLCPHQAASLGKGRCLPTGQVECPWHHYLFNLRTGSNTGGTAMDVEKYEVKTDETGVYIGIQ